jgi:hypothetical protein
MPYKLSLPAVAALLALPAFAGAAETYTLKLKQLGKGDVAQVEIQTTRQPKLTLRDPEKKPDEKPLYKSSRTIIETTAFKEEILARPAGKPPTSVRRTYTKAKAKEGDRTSSYPWEGKTLLIDKKEKGYEFKIEGGRLLVGLEAAPLAGEFAREEDLPIDRLFFPKKAVAVGDEWKLDMEALVKELKGGAMEFDVAKSKGTGKLTKAYKKGGRQYGSWTIRYELPIKSAGTGGEKMTAEAGSVQKVEITFDGCIDGSSASGTTKMRFEVKLAGTYTDRKANRKFHIDQDDTTETEVRREEGKP